MMIDIEITDVAAKQALEYLLHQDDEMPMPINDENTFAAALLFCGLKRDGLVTSHKEGDNLIWSLTEMGRSVARGVRQ